jgi:hypothetical protein
MIEESGKQYKTAGDSGKECKCAGEDHSAIHHDSARDWRVRLDSKAFASSIQKIAGYIVVSETSGRNGRLWVSGIRTRKSLVWNME